MEIESAPKSHDEENKTCTNAGMITFILGLVAGTFSALICKMAYDTKSVGLDGEEKAFAKPIMMLTLMFAGMSPALLFWWLHQRTLPPEERDVIPMKTVAILVVPSLCDLFCTLLLLVAQLYITASLWQMMRGSIIIITALLKRYALGHNLKIHMWLGVGFITFAMILVASTSFVGPSADAAANSKDPRVGILLVLVGCIAQGVQYVFEEKVMAVDNAPPLVVIGCEGLWGTVLSILVVYPLAYLAPGQDNGSFENPFDALAMITSSPQLTTLTILFVLTVTCYNCAVVYVTKFLSAIWHAILDNFRPITIWGMDLAIFYVFMPGTGFGESWLPSSWLQLGGLVILLFGTAVYNGSIWTFSDVQYSALAQGEDGVTENSIIKTEPSMASPSITRSPLVYHASPGGTARVRTSSINAKEQKGYGSNGTSRFNEV
mmetsp:Transcript_121409/g.238537  ORF Transcript_121409/g.238537 Transcript_121409/m.238537 type:complete len:433 (+) Transcript_121409:110-1408(+)